MRSASKVTASMCVSKNAFFTKMALVENRIELSNVMRIPAREREDLCVALFI